MCSRTPLETPVLWSNPERGYDDHLGVTTWSASVLGEIYMMLAYPNQSAWLSGWHILIPVYITTHMPRVKVWNLHMTHIFSQKSWWHTWGQKFHCSKKVGSCFCPNWPGTSCGQPPSLEYNEVHNIFSNIPGPRGKCSCELLVSAMSTCPPGTAKCVKGLGALICDITPSKVLPKPP